jgi:hypothetical protein
MQEHASNDPDYADRLINEQEAANFLGYSVRALQNWRLRGGGPQYVRVSRRSVRYRRRDLIAFAEARLEAHTSARPEPSSSVEGDQAAEEGSALAAEIEEAPTSDPVGSPADCVHTEPQKARGRRLRTLLPHDRD